MAEIMLNTNRKIGDGRKPYIVAEMNSSHNGKIERAKEMILAAKECGCDCVKFQSWSAESLYSEEYYKENPISRRMVKGFSLDSEKLYELYQFCLELGIDFSSTPYSEEEVDFLADRVKVPFIKVSSMEINNYSYLKYIAQKGVPVVLSTGMASYEEIEKAVGIFSEAGNENVCILHCVSVYPAEANLINLKNISYLKKKYPQHVIGYSDHTLGNAVACGAVALGACFIEKHFTLDNTKMGMDNNMATEPDEMKRLVEACNAVYEALGKEERIISAEEKQQQKKMRRSIVAKEDLPEGSIIEEGMLGFMRPGTGLEPCRAGELIGKRVNKEIKRGFMIRLEDVE